MQTRVVPVPISLLLDPQLTPQAKLIWMAIRHFGRVRLDTRTGLSRPTIAKGLAELAAAGWSSTAPNGPITAVNRAPADACVIVPADLIVDRRTGVRGRILYGLLQWTPAFRNQAGQFAYPSLCRLTGSSLNTVKQAVSELVHTGWLRVTQANRRAPVQFSFSNPVVARAEAEVARASRRLEEARFRGEALMREYLSLLVDSHAFEDNAAPGFLVNPLTDQRMELDRYYPPHVAFEFNGPQHYGATDRFSGEDAAKQRTRDYIKLGICMDNGITVVVIHSEDLRLETMRQKVGQLLPLRNLQGHEPLIAFLESAGRRYRLAARRKQG